MHDTYFPYPLDNVVKKERYDYILHNTLDDNNPTRDVSQYDKCPQRQDFSRIVARVKVTRRQYVTLHDPKVYPHTNVWIHTSNNIIICSGHIFSRIEARGQGHSDRKIVCNTPRPHGVSAHPFWDSYLN